MRRGRGVALAGIVLAASSLAGCSLTRSSDTSGTPTGAASPVRPTSPPTSAPHTPSPGTPTPSPTGPTRLHLGESTAAEWSPNQHVTARIRLTVTALERADWSYFRGWHVSAHTRHNTRPYFIRATVANEGGDNLGGFRVPLYALDDDHQLVEASTFGSTGTQVFAPCHPDTLPTHFRTGYRVHACLVTLVPRAGTVVGASYRPHQDSRETTWSGQVRQLPPHHG